MRSCARHLLVAASSRRTEEKVASRRGSGRHCLSASRALGLSDRLIMLAVPRRRDLEHLPKEAPNYMLKEAHGLLLDKRSDHIREHSSDSVEALIGLADVSQSHIVEEDLLNDKDGNSLGELRSRLHDSQTERDDFGGKQEVDDFAGVILNKRADDTEGGKAQVFERA
jgi:hypothetical protein